MKMHPASLYEIRRISIGTVVLDALMIALLYTLDGLGVGSFPSSPVMLSALVGSMIAIINFTILCITVQQAVGMEHQKKMQATFQLSYHIRMVIQAVWVIACYFAPGLNLLAGALPLFFPKITIVYLRTAGKFSVPGEA